MFKRYIIIFLHRSQTIQKMGDMVGPSTSKKVKRSESRSVREKQIVLRVFHCLERDHQPPKDDFVHMCCNSTCVPPNNQPGISTSLSSTITKDKLVDMCSDYTGVPKSSIYKILREAKIHGDVQTPKTSSGRKKITVDEEAKTSIRRTIHSFFFRNELPTLQTVLEALSDHELVPKMGKETLRKILHEMKFTYGKVDRKSILIERQEIIAWRRNYLRKIDEFRKLKKKLYFMDETWVNQGHTVKKVWQDGNITSARQAFNEGLSVGLKQPSGKGSRLIVTHIGSDSGFLPNGELIFKSKKTGDYHEEMNAEVFEKWFEGIIQLVEPGSVIVMDNAPYHSRHLEPLPKQSWKKAAIQEWLINKNIQYNKDSLKAELLQLTKLHTDKYKKFAVDEMALSRGITVLRLPPYHCELNPIELIWAQVKGYVARENRTFKLVDVQHHLQEAIRTVSAEDWKKCMQHVLKEEQKMWDVDNRIDHNIEPIIIHFDDSGSSSDESEVED